MLARNFFEYELADGKTYKISKLTIGIIADLEQWHKDKRKAETLKLAKELYGDSPPVELFEKVLKPVSTEELDAALETVEGMRKMVWFALLEFNPNITEQEVGRLLTPEIVKNIAEQMNPETEKKTNPETR